MKAIIVILTLFLVGCRIPQKEPLSDIEAMRLRQQILFEFYFAWRLEQDERDLLPSPTEK